MRGYHLLREFDRQILMLDYDEGRYYEIKEYEITSTKLTLHKWDRGELFIEIYEKR